MQSPPEGTQRMSSPLFSDALLLNGTVRNTQQVTVGQLCG